MYHLSPHSLFTKVVAATDIMYSLPSYHVESEYIPVSSTTAATSSSDGICPDFLLDQQVALIKRINALSRLFQQSEEATTKKLQETCVSEKGKIGSKVARKAEKAAKKEAHKSAAATQGITVTFHPFVITAAKPEPRDVGQAIPACTSSRFLDLSVPAEHAWISLNATGTEADKGWMMNVERLANRKGMKVNFTHDQGAFSAAAERNGAIQNFKSRVNFWQYIGECLGLYSDEYVTMALHADDWLHKAEKVLQKSMSQEALMRSASCFLSRWDNLGTVDAFGIVDVIVSGVLEGVPKSNNVELFEKRIQCALSQN
uniref:DUF659 domain-containing protein n=1 Tax=Steinernema glaseri TaxID=37863 RepID=A0A1I7YEE7_9BILA